MSEIDNELIIMYVPDPTYTYEVCTLAYINRIVVPYTFIKPLWTIDKYKIYGTGIKYKTIRYCICNKVTEIVRRQLNDDGLIMNEIKSLNELGVTDSDLIDVPVNYMCCILPNDIPQLDFEKYKENVQKEFIKKVENAIPI